MICLLFQFFKSNNNYILKMENLLYELLKVKEYIITIIHFRKTIMKFIFFIYI